MVNKTLPEKGTSLSKVDPNPRNSPASPFTFTSCFRATVISENQGLLFYCRVNL